jgi:hypothetical protein
MERVPVLDADGKPTGQFEHKWGKGGELGYLEWLARNHPTVFGSLYGKLIPLDVNAKIEEKPVVHYETVEERRAAMIAAGWSPASLAALEEAIANANLDFNTWITSTGVTSSISNGRDGGWTVGGGLEYGFTPYLSAGIEYNFTRINIGDRNQTVSPGLIAPETVTGAHSGIQTLMARLNFRFAPFR